MSYSIKHSGIKGMSWGKKKYVRKYKAGTSDPEGELKPGETRTGNVDGWIYVYKTGSESEEEKTEGLIDDAKDAVEDIIDKGSEIFSNIAEWVKNLFDDSEETESDKDAAKLARQALRDDRDKIYEQSGEKEALIQKNYEQNMENQFGEKTDRNWIEEKQVDNGNYARWLAESNKAKIINGDYHEKWRENNCVLCSVAADLTKRGYSVEALASSDGLVESDIEKLYETKGRTFNKYTFYDTDNHEKRNTPSQMVDDLSKQPNTSGIFEFDWMIGNSVGRHAVFYSVDAKGNVGLYDAQVGEYISSSDFMHDEKQYTNADLSKISYNDTSYKEDYDILAASILRTDDLDVNINNMAKVVRSSSAAKSEKSGMVTSYASNQYITKKDDTNWTLDRKPTAAEREKEASESLKEMKRKR